MLGILRAAYRIALSYLIPSRILILLLVWIASNPRPAFAAGSIFDDERAARGNEAVDILKLAKIDAKGTRGHWTLSDSGLTNTGDSWIEIPANLQGDYDMEVKLKRTQGSKEIGFVFPAGALAELEFAGGDGNSSTIYGKPKVEVHAPKIENNTELTLTFHVKSKNGNSQIAVSLNGDKYIFMKCANESLEVHPKRSPSDPRFVAIRVHPASVVTIQSIVVSKPDSVVAATQAAGATGDPETLAPPKDLPEFRELIKGEKWDAQYAEALTRLGPLDELAKSSLPESGTQVMFVVAESTAAKLGIVVGNVISEIDGKALDDDYDSRRLTREQQFTVVDRNGKARRIDVPAGSLGFDSLDLAWPERIYLRKGTRGAAWDPYAAVGAANCISKPDLAETAWRHALAAGYKPDFISDYCAAQIAWRQGRNPDALGYLARLQSRANVPGSLKVRTLTRELGLANFKLKEAQESLPVATNAAYPGNSSERLASLLSLHRALREADRVGPSPSLIATFPKTDLLPKIKPLLQGDKNMDDYQKWATKELIGKQGKYAEEIPTDHFRVLMESPGVDAPDAELVVQVQIKPHDLKPNQNGRLACFKLINCDETDPKGWSMRHPTTEGMLTASIEPTGVCLVMQGTRECTLLGHAHVIDDTAANRRFTLRLIHARGREEVWINQRRLLYVPALERPKRVGFAIGAQGMDIDVHVEFFKLDPTLAEEP